MPKGGDNDGTRWARVLRGMEQTDPVTPWDKDFRDSHAQMRFRGNPDPDLPITPDVIPASGMVTSDVLEGKARMAVPCSRCGQSLGERVTPGAVFGSLLCEGCSDPRELSWIKKPRGRPRRTY